MIKAIFFDIDGTLLSHNQGRIPHSTITALQELKKRNILIFIATGRHISEMKDLPIHEIDFDGYITLNGQYCYNNKEIIYHMPIAKNDIKNIIKEIDIHPFPCIFVEKDQMYINYNNDIVQKVQDAIHTPLPNIGDLHRGYHQDIYQVIPYGIDRSKEEDLLKLMPHCKKTRWHDFAIDIISKNGGKKQGIKKVLEYYHISQEQTMSFGDGNNDIDMFEITKISVAMGNASDKVKKHASYVSDDVDHDGIYHALKHFQII